MRTGTWLNEPRDWNHDGGTLRVTTDAGSDFWRETHYGFVRDSGHFFGIATGAAFTAEVRVRGHFAALYDQAGLMVRVDAEHWVKAGVERSDGRPMIGSVMTAGRSDWALAPYADDAGDFRIRATVAGGVLRLQTSADGTHWPLLRLCPFPIAASYLVGPMCCSPERGGLVTRFSDFVLEPPSTRDLHDLG